MHGADGSDALAQELATFFAEKAALQINVFDRAGKVHYATVVFAVDQSEAVPKFVDRLFFASMVEQVGVFGQSVEFLTEPVSRNDGRRIVELSFAEDERKGRNEQVYVRHPASR